jgi:hypothetical protein
LGRDQTRLALDVAGRDRDLVAELEHDGAACEPANTNLRTGKVRENRNVTIRFPGQTPDTLERFPVAGVLPVGHVEPKYIDAGLNQTRNGAGVIRGGPECRYDFRAPKRKQLDFGINGHGR